MLKLCTKSACNLDVDLTFFEVSSLSESFLGREFEHKVFLPGNDVAILLLSEFHRKPERGTNAWKKRSFFVGAQRSVVDPGS